MASRNKVLCALNFAIRRRKVFLTESLKRYYRKGEIMVTDNIVIDLRSDTVTKPSAGMRAAMAAAEVGDDVMKEDPTLNELEARCAKLFGYEAALFVPSGSMGNLICVMGHTTRRGGEIIVGKDQHIHKYEQGSYAQFGGVSATTIPNEPDGTIRIESIEAALRNSSDFHQPHSEVVCLENTHNYCGGRVLPMEYIKNVYSLAKQNNMAVHIDGARIMNAAIASGVQLSHILKYADSVSMCFSKGLGAPVGSVIGGTKEFIKRAERSRKALGGGMRQAGVLAAACLFALDTAPQQIAQDHANAQALAQGIDSLNSPLVTVDPKSVETNILIMKTTVDAAKIVELLQTIFRVSHRSPVIDIKDFVAGVEYLKEYVCGVMTPTSESPTIVRCFNLTDRIIRWVTHSDVPTEHVNLTLQKLQYVVNLLKHSE